MRLVSSLVALSLFACGSPSGSKQPTPPAPNAKVPGQVTQNRDARPISGTAPLPALPPPAQGTVKTPVAVVSPTSDEGKFLASIATARWRTQCERKASSSLFYGIDFTMTSWSSLFFEYTDNNSCIHTAAPNEGVPKTYAITAMKLQEDGWYRLDGVCLSAANGCTGKATIGVRLNAQNVVEVKKISATGTYFPAGADELTFDF